MRGGRRRYRPISTGTPIPPERAFDLLGEWAGAEHEVGLVYTPSHGETILLLRGTVGVENEKLRVRSGSDLLLLSLAGSTFHHGPISLFGRGPVPTESPPGLHVSTPHGDWLFLAHRFSPVPLEEES